MLADHVGDHISTRAPAKAADIPEENVLTIH
jgi:hypothetical protein